MRVSIAGVGAMIVVLPCLCLLATGQVKGAKSKAAPVSAAILEMRNLADTNARALATAVQAHAIETGSYNPVLADYAREMGGHVPINPCTGTRTGYGLTVTDKHRTAIVSAYAGSKCGKWTPMRFQLTL